jgi:hypothetical protein
MRKENARMSLTKQSSQTTHRKFLERLRTLHEGRSALAAELLPSARDFIEIGAGSSSSSGLHFRYVVGRNKTRVELFIARPDAADNKRIFDKLESHKHEIVAAFKGKGEGELSWERLEDRRQ